MAYSPAGIFTNLGQSEQSLKYSKSKSVAIAVKAKTKGKAIEKLKIIMSDEKIQFNTNKSGASLRIKPNNAYNRQVIKKILSQRKN